MLWQKSKAEISHRLHIVAKIRNEWFFSYRHKIHSSTVNFTKMSIFYNDLGKFHLQEERLYTITRNLLYIHEGQTV